LSKMISGKKCRHLNRERVDIGKAGFEVLGFPTLPPTCFCDTTNPFWLMR